MRIRDRAPGLGLRIWSPLHYDMTLPGTRAPVRGPEGRPGGPGAGRGVALAGA